MDDWSDLGGIFDAAGGGFDMSDMGDIFGSINNSDLSEIGSILDAGGGGMDFGDTFGGTVGSSGGFDNLFSDLAPGAASTAADAAKPWYSDYLKPQNLGPALAGGVGLFGELGKNDLAYQQMAAAQAKDKMAALIELAKLKYGNKGGGGGGARSTRNRNQDLIDVLTNGANGKLAALDSLTKNYAGALNI